MSENTTYTKKCLNCQTPLQGTYCHVCGQKATQEKPTIKEFILEYLNIAFIWDTHFAKTMWQTFRRPGHLTNEYVSGKFVSYTHPLKLNMFLLFIFITSVLLFNKTEDMKNSVQNLTRNEIIYPVLQLGILTDNLEYNEILKADRKDTVTLYAPQLLAETYPELISNLDTINSVSSESMSYWTAAVPHKLIEDDFFVKHPAGYYHAEPEDPESFENLSGTKILEMVLQQMLKLTTKYFPLLILLTAPFLSLLVRAVLRKSNSSHFKHFIFSLHYTAFLEMIIIFIYMVHLIAAPPIGIMQWVLIASSCIYLTFAFKRAYETRTWYGAVCQAVIINIGYSMILFATFCVILLISIIIVAFQI